MRDKIVHGAAWKLAAEVLMPDPDNQEDKADQEFLEKMGIAAEAIVYPQSGLSQEELRREMQWRMTIARG